MTERLRVAKVRKMSDEALFGSWLNGDYPFDRLKGCNLCPTQHITEGLCGTKKHKSLVDDLPTWDRDEVGTVGYIRKNIVKLFALRRKYDRFYKKVRP